MNSRQQRLSASQLRLRSRHPFFASLALYARIQITSGVDSAATNGLDVFFNPEFLDRLRSEEVDAVLLHEVLHAALLHVTRRGARDPVLWNFAADIVVNAMLTDQGMKLPAGAVECPDWADRSAEEVYDLLLKGNMTPPNHMVLDLQAELAVGGVTGDQGPGSATSPAALREHWRQARQQAQVLARQLAKGQGSAAAGLGRDWERVEGPQIDWRAELWRHLVQTPVDFQGFDRRFIYRGIYLDQMDGESLNLWVAVDTSGSVDAIELGAFVAELEGIVGSYPSIRCKVFYADAELYGPYDLDSDGPIPDACGGGGTSFVPFFAEISATAAAERPYVCVYLTDGFGEFPPEPPELPTLWVVTPGGLMDDRFPFGEVLRLTGAHP